METNPGPVDEYHLPEETRWGIVIHRKDLKWKRKDVAKKYDVAPDTVSRVMKKYRETKTVSDRPGRGRKRALSEQDEKKVRRQAKKGKTSPQIARKLSRKVSARTIQRTIKKSGLKWLRIKKVDKLTRAHEEKRLQYAQEKKDYNWKNVMFSDEKSFWLGSTPEYAWQDPHNRIQVEVSKYPPKLHVWAAIGYHVKSKLYFFEQNLTAALYQRIIKARLKESQLTYSPNCPQKLSKKWVFLQDNDPKHKAKKTMQELKKIVGNRLIPHPAYSPDLNPAEDIWSYLDRKLKEATVTTIPGLKRFLSKEWKALPWSVIRASVDSMPRRLEECIKLNGKRTHY